jgi:carbamoyl-phosphate synthase large subunit
VLTVARRLHALGMTLYATEGTADAIRSLGIPVSSVQSTEGEDGIHALLEKGVLQYLIYTGAVKDAKVGDYIVLHRRAMQLSIPCFTSLDTAEALCRILASHYSEENTEPVDINAMRQSRRTIPFTKMQSDGNDYIFVENFDGKVSCPESLCVSLCAPHTGIGADGIVLIEPSLVADAKMRSFNRDGSLGLMAGNNIRCVAKWLYDRGRVTKDRLMVETPAGVVPLKLYLRNGKVSSVTVDLGEARFAPEQIPTTLSGDEILDLPLTVLDQEWRVSLVNVGNPHCVVFHGGIDSLDLSKIGPAFEKNEVFPERINTEFVRVVNRTTLRCRFWERGNGETLSCGTGAAAAVAAAVRLGLCPEDRDVTVHTPGGTLTVKYEGGHLFLTGNAVKVFDGEFEY